MKTPKKIREHNVQRLFFAVGLFVILLRALTAIVNAQNTAPTKKWDVTYGGSNYDPLTVTQQTTDGGYIMGGYSLSGISGDKTQASQGVGDYWIVKTDHSGIKQWDATFGGIGTDYLSSLQQTDDGGFILGGYSNSGISGDKTQLNQGEYDYWIVKTDANGVKQWDATFGGSSNDQLTEICITDEGGFMLGGYSNSNISGDKSQTSQGYADYWIVKTDANGVKQWDARFGGNKDDLLYSLQQTADGGYILGGSSFSGLSGDKTQESQGARDYWTVRTDANGIKQWDARFGGGSDDYLLSLQQTIDGGYILGGYSYSGFGGDKTQLSQGGYDYWIVKADANGIKQWDKRFGGSGWDFLYSLWQTADEGYILGGFSDSEISGDKTQASQGYDDYWIVKTDANGAKQWDARFGGSMDDKLISLGQISDGGYVLGGMSQSGMSGDKTQVSQGDFDYWLVKVTFDCNSGITVYADADDDSYGDATSSYFATDCIIPVAYVLDSADCNDSNASVHPGVTEILNGIDDNCNGTIDEGVAPNTWGKLSNIGEMGRVYAVGFSIGNKGYIGTGYNEIAFLNDFWEYDPAANTWTQKADFGGVARGGAVGFSIGNKGYLGTGENFTDGTIRYKDFWEYNPDTNNWTQKADFGGSERSFAVGFSIGSKGYIGTGTDSVGNYSKDFWEYDPAVNKWIQKSDFGGDRRTYAVGFSIGKKGYIGTGNSSYLSLTRDFWEYDPAANSWKRRAHIPEWGKYGGVGFSIGSKGYLGTGYDAALFAPFFEYEPVSNSWIKKSDFGGGGSRVFAVGFSIGDKGYIGTGHADKNYNDFWQYTPETISSCPVPSGMKTTNITAISAKLEWDYVGDAMSYNLRYKIAGTNMWTVTNHINYVKQNISGLIPNTVYYWEVNSWCSVNPNLISEWSEKQSFTTGSVRLNDAQAASIDVYPNPVAESFMLDIQLGTAMDESATIYLQNALGQIVYSSNEITGNGELKKVISMPPSLSSGWYIVRVVLSDQVIEQKLLYEK